jgi:hypothetical protein
MKVAKIRREWPLTLDEAARSEHEERMSQGFDTNDCNCDK